MSSIVKVDTIQENTSANGITVDGLNIKDSKLVTANSVVAANITADAIDATKIADNAISEEHLDVTAITGHTAETSIADGDLVLIHDASASALRKMTKANFVSGIGGANTPYCYGELQNSQVVSRGVFTKLTGLTYNEIDTDSAFDGTTFTVPSNKNGNYFIVGNIQASFTSIGNDGEQVRAAIYKNGSLAKQAVYYDQATDSREVNVKVSAVLSLVATDTIELYGRVWDADNGNASLSDSTNSLTIFKLI